jgi:hypothetical protein
MELKKTLATLIKIDAFLDVIGYNNDEIRENIELSKKEIEAINYTRCSTEVCECDKPAFRITTGSKYCVICDKDAES